MNRPNMSESSDILGLLWQREIKDNISLTVKRRLHVTRSMVMRLALEKELEGHNGCVNCLEWNESGRMLASASDDLHVILWNPFLNKRLCSIHTGHNGNIFSVKFMPRSGDNTLVTGAGDCRIMVHDVVAKATTHTCTCHTGRVKRIATAPNLPFMFWSAGEDGRITQFDLRSPHTCSKGANVLVNLVDHLGRYAEAKCLAVNPLRPEQLAVGANDPYVRLYDRRMLTLSAAESPARAPTEGEPPRPLRERGQPSEGESSLPPGCVQYFVAGHLPVKELDYKKRYRNLASTYLTFGGNGNDLLVNLGGEQIYLFDVTNRREAKAFTAVLAQGDADKTPGAAEGCSTPRHGTNGVVKAALKEEALPPLVEELKQQANTAYENEKYTVAISLYNRAIVLSPQAAVLYGNRAMAYMKRLWDGDMYAAMRDCLEAIARNSEHWKAHLRLARCLLELRWIAESRKCLEIFKAKFSQHTHDYACGLLEKELEATGKKNATETKEKETASEESSIESELWVHPTTMQESAWRANAYDYEVRFCGHCNTTTDIKEANFFGADDAFVMGGSDDGTFFVWDRESTEILRVMKADDSIVNCLQPHPTSCMLATSGIDPVVRIWTPGPEDGRVNEREVSDFETAASANQRLMSADPLDVMLLNMGIPGGNRRDPQTPIQCQPC